MSPKPQLILFDLIGTLLYVEERDPPYWHSLAEILERRGIEQACSFNERYARWRAERDRSDRTREVTLQERLACLLPEIGDAVVEDLVSAYMDEYAKRTVPCEGVPAMLEAWHGRVPLGVVSNFFVADIPRLLLEQHRLLHYFDFVVDSASVGFRKPAAEIFRYALGQAALQQGSTSHILMIGDDWDADVEGAKAMGFQPVYYSRSPARHDGVSVIRHWDEFRPSP